MQTPNERLRLVRKALNLSQVEISKILNIKQGSYSDVERGRSGVGVSNTIKLILKDKYSVSIDYLTTGEGDMFLTTKTERKSEEPFRKKVVFKKDGVVFTLEEAINLVALNKEEARKYKNYNDIIGVETLRLLKEARDGDTFNFEKLINIIG
jgi:transcriptional regulator with XRE-family HTH domain